LCDFYSMYIIYKCGYRPHNTSWWAVGWRHIAYIISLPVPEFKGFFFFYIEIKCLLTSLQHRHNTLLFPPLCHGWFCPQKTSYMCWVSLFFILYLSHCMLGLEMMFSSVPCNYHIYSCSMHLYVWLTQNGRICERVMKMSLNIYS